MVVHADRGQPEFCAEALAEPLSMKNKNTLKYQTENLPRDGRRGCFTWTIIADWYASGRVFRSVRLRTSEVHLWRSGAVFVGTKADASFLAAAQGRPRVIKPNTDEIRHERSFKRPSRTVRTPTGVIFIRVIIVIYGSGGYRNVIGFWRARACRRRVGA